MNNPGQHTTVLLNEAVEALINGNRQTTLENRKPKSIYVDGTFGRGGHTRLLLSRLDVNSEVIAFDKDPAAVMEGALIKDVRFEIRHKSFRHLEELSQNSIDGVLLDLGISSPQVDRPERGFSFRFEGPLDMRMDTTRGQSVAAWIAKASFESIAKVIKEYGEERFAASIARSIVERRESGRPVTTTIELAELVGQTVKTREHGQNPATRTFQAFRIFINEELEELKAALDASLDILRPGGRLVVISFHSLEDRIVKQFIEKKF